MLPPLLLGGSVGRGEVVSLVKPPSQRSHGAIIQGGDRSPGDRDRSGGRKGEIERVGINWRGRTTEGGRRIIGRRGSRQVPQRRQGGGGEAIPGNKTVQLISREVGIVRRI